MEELVARIETRLRRPPVVTVPGSPEPPATKSFGPFVFDLERAGVFRDGERLPLTHQEFRLLQVLVENEGKVLDGAALLNLAWGYDNPEISSRTLYVHMSWLRQKLKTPDRPDGHIQTVRGFGYVFTP
jgi:DNA-binding response OmpR family regulator